MDLGPTIQNDPIFKWNSSLCNKVMTKKYIDITYFISPKFSKTLRFSQNLWKKIKNKKKSGESGLKNIYILPRFYSK